MLLSSNTPMTDAARDNREAQAHACLLEKPRDLILFDNALAQGNCSRQSMVQRQCCLGHIFATKRAGERPGSHLLLRTSRSFAGTSLTMVCGRPNPPGTFAPLALVFIMQQRGRASPSV
jgi:hypothetical protein